MTQTFEATYDGKVLRPLQELSLAPHTTVRVTITYDKPVEEQPQSFLQVARSLNLPGPPDWSTNLDDYLYGGKDPTDE